MINLHGNITGIPHTKNNFLIVALPHSPNVEQNPFKLINAGMGHKKGWQGDGQVLQASPTPLNCIPVEIFQPTCDMLLTSNTITTNPSISPTFSVLFSTILYFPKGYVSNKK